MRTIKFTTVIHQPVERVVAFARDPQKLHIWQPDALESVPLPPESGGDGARYINKARGWAGLTLEVTEDAREILPGRRYVMQSRERHGWITGQSQWDYEPVSDGTRVTVQHDVALHGWLRLLGPVFMAGARSKVEGDLARLKKILEASAQEIKTG